MVLHPPRALNTSLRARALEEFDRHWFGARRVRVPQLPASHEIYIHVLQGRQENEQIAQKLHYD